MQFRSSINILTKNGYYNELRLTGPLLSIISFAETKRGKLRKG